MMGVVFSSRRHRMPWLLLLATATGCASVGGKDDRGSGSFGVPYNPDPIPLLAPVPNLQASATIDLPAPEDEIFEPSAHGDGQVWETPVLRRGEAGGGPSDPGQGPWKSPVRVDKEIVLAGYGAEAMIDLPVPGEVPIADETESTIEAGEIELDPAKLGGTATHIDYDLDGSSGLHVDTPASLAPMPCKRPGLLNRLGCWPGGKTTSGPRKFNGKHQNPRPDMGVNNPYFPRELRMRSHPQYVVEPPDELYIEALQVLPQRPLLGIRLVRQDGTISLGYYGQIHVAGLTILEIENKLRAHLSNYVEDPQVYVDVASFNSKVYYVLGQVNQQGRLPITGKETALDAILLAGGLTNFADKSKIHVARPNPGGGCDQILWVDWKAIAFAGDTRTNYQLLPGDRVVVPGTKGFGTSVMFDNYLSPVERIASLFSLLRFTLESGN